MKKLSKPLAILVILMLILPQFAGFLPTVSASGEETTTEEETTGANDDTASDDEGNLPGGDETLPDDDDETSEEDKDPPEEDEKDDDEDDETPTEKIPETEAEIFAARISGIPGLYASAAQNDVFVTGSAAISSTFVLDIPPDIAVSWQANLSGPVSSSYLINLTGSGAFELSNCTIANPGTGGTINITGAGTIITVGSGAAVLSDRGGNAILINVSDVTVNVTSGGTVRSLSGNSNAAVQVNRDMQNVIINADGGSISSDAGGYAINDGAGTGTVNNNTMINIGNAGTVFSGTACAIHSTGTNSVVSISGGAISNTAGNNANPTIYMNGGSGKNVIVSGGTVQNLATNAISYTIQTTGNVEVSGGEVTTVAGRAINLVGLNSSVTVSGGTVSASTTGTAICTATTDTATVANASVVITGGLVSTASGHAIRITGANSRVTVSGGIVSSADGNAINADSSATRSQVTVSGGSVMSDIGYAIQSFGTGSTVTVSDNGSGGAGGQVSVLRTGAAISSKGAVNVTGGFVFAYGTNVSTAIIGASVNRPSDGGGGQICVWNEALGNTVYTQETSLHLTTAAIGAAGAQWFLDQSSGSGIYYRNGATTGFFPLSFVSVTDDYGLIFDSETGRMYMNVDGTGTLTPENIPFNNSRYAGLWAGQPGKLTLNGFLWKTSAPTALTIVGGDAAITLSGENRFVSVHSEGQSMGIKSNGFNIALDGDGVLTAKGSDTDIGYGIDLGDGGELTMIGGTLFAQGGHAISRAGASPEASFYRWAYSGDYDGADRTTGYGPDIEFISYSTDQFVMFQTLIPVSFTAAPIGGVRGMADSIGIALTFSEPVSELTLDDIQIAGKAVAGTLSGSGDSWIIALDNVDDEGLVSVKVNHFGIFYVRETEQDVDISKAADNGSVVPVVVPAASLSVVLEARKVVMGAEAAITSGQFSFAVYDEDNHLITTGKNDENGNIRFAAIVYSSAQRHTYTMIETSIDGNNWTTDHREYTVTVTVTGDGSALSAAVAYSGGTIPTFYNKYGDYDEFPQLFISEHTAYINGYPDGTVRPDQNISRAEVAMVFYRLMIDEVRDVNPTVQSLFTDVRDAGWFSDAISVMNAMAIISGYPDGTYRPSNDITKAELASIVARFGRHMHIMPQSNADFRDLSGHWAARDINYVVSIGWMDGYSDGTFRPRQHVTRAEFVVLVNRMLGRVPETVDDLLSEEMKTWIDNADTTAWYYIAIQEATNSHMHEYKDKPIPGLYFNYEHWVEMLP